MSDPEEIYKSHVWSSVYAGLLYMLERYTEIIMLDTNHYFFSK